MPFVPFPAGIVEAIARFSWGGIPGEITLGARWQLGGDPLDSQMDDLASVIGLWIHDLYRPAQTNTITWGEVVINDLIDATGRQRTHVIAETGTNAGNSVPQNVAMTVTFLTGLRGRSYRGRNFCPGLVRESLANPRQWGAALVAQMNNVYEQLAIRMDAAGWDHVVLSRFTDGAPRVIGDDQQINGYRANIPVATLRSRLT